MCGRYSISGDPAKLAERFNVPVPEEVSQPRYNAAPTQELPVVLDDGTRHMALLRWGLIPRWAKDESIGNKLINARGETVEEKPSFRDAFERRRVLPVVTVDAEGRYVLEGK